MNKNEMNTRHDFGAVKEVDNGFQGVLLVMVCRDCKATVGGDKPSDLYDVEEWSGVCKPVAAANAALVYNSPERRGLRSPVSEPLTYSPFAVLEGVFS